MVKLGHVALDGSKIKANASQHKAMSYDRMKQEDQRLRQEISELTLQAQRTDRREDALYGNAQGDDLQGELAHRKSRLAKIQESMAALEERAKVKAKAEKDKQEKEQQSKKDDDDLNDQNGKKKPGRPRKEKSVADVPDDKAQRNFTDPESRIMPSKNGFVQAYNVQNVVDEAYQIIVATEVTDHPNDAGILRTMVEMTEQNAGRNAKKISCDTDYFCQDDIMWLEGKGIDPYIATGRQKHSEVPIESPRGRIPKHYTIKQRMARKLSTKKRHAVYARRKVIIEPVFVTRTYEGPRRMVVGYHVPQPTEDIPIRKSTVGSLTCWDSLTPATGVNRWIS